MLDELTTDEELSATLELLGAIELDITELDITELETTELEMTELETTTLDDDSTTELEEGAIELTDETIELDASTLETGAVLLLGCVPPPQADKPTDAVAISAVRQWRNTACCNKELSINCPLDDEITLLLAIIT